MLKSDESLDFHNKQIAEVALGQRCRYADRSCAYILTSPLGNIYTNACPNGLHCTKLYGDTSYDDIKWNTKVDFIRSSSLLPSNKHANQLKKWLQTYFTDPLQCKDIEISFCGLDEYGEFNSKIWMTILNTCPAGELMSYSELAERSGYGFGASKVVGYAINKNPYMLVVGDHRVVKATGEIWCENASQRNKLRRLLVHYEIGFTSMSLDQALLVVKERNGRSKNTRKRGSTSVVSTKAKKVKSESEDEPKKGKAKRAKTPNTKRQTKRSKTDEDSDEEDEDESDDETEEE